MAQIEGSLTRAIAEHAANRRMIRLSIDESDRKLNKVPHYLPPSDPDRPRTALRNKLWMNQLQVISTCAELRIPLVEISFAMSIKGYSVTAVDDSPVHFEYVKSEANALRDDNELLLMFLRQGRFDTLIVMGYHANACVVSTVGADRLMPPSFLPPTHYGALQHRFTVMTCEQILTAGDSAETTSEQTKGRWDYDREGLEFYSQV